MQLRFTIAIAVLLAMIVVAMLPGIESVADEQRRPLLGTRTVAVDYRPDSMDPSGFGALRLAGAWRVASPDPRFGGLSGLDIASGRLVALTDFGAVVSLPKPDGTRPVRATVLDLPDGPGDPRLKRGFDSEALLSLGSGRGWLVGFERINELWRYDERFKRPLGRWRVPRGVWPWAGFEALAGDRGTLLLLPESGGEALRTVLGGRSIFVPFEAGRVSEAKSLPGGGILVIERNSGLAGFANRLVMLCAKDRGYRAVRSFPLGVGRLDNMEGLAVEQGANGSLRLWLVSDDDQRWPMRTLLLALDWPIGVPRGC